MQRLPPRTFFRVVQLPSWAMALIGLAAGAVLLALGLALFVVLAPVAVALFFYIRWKVRKTLRELNAQQDAMRRESQQQQRGGIIDVDYVVIEDPERRR